MMMKEICLIIPVLFAISFSAHGTVEKRQTCGNYLQAPHLKFLDVDLEKAIGGTGLRVHELEKIRLHSEGIVDIYQFIKSNRKGILLGPSEPFDIYDSVARVTGATRWPEAYYSFGIDPGELGHTAKFMETLVKQDEPIFFLVPTNLWVHRNTGREMWWLLQHPEAMKNVTFIFGIFDIIDQKNWDEVFSARNLGRPGPNESQTFWEQRIPKITVALKRFSELYR